MFKIDPFNEENNPMYSLNLALGFKPAPARLAYKKIIMVEWASRRTARRVMSSNWSALPM